MADLKISQFHPVHPVQQNLVRLYIPLVGCLLSFVDCNAGLTAMLLCPLNMLKSPDQTRPDQTRPDQTRPDQTRPDQTRPDQTRPDQTKKNRKSWKVSIVGKVGKVGKVEEV